MIVRQILCGPLQENAYLVYDETSDDALLIDPGDDLTVLEKELTACGKKLTDILLTHGHFDHILSVQPLREKYGARVHIHPLDAYMLESEDGCMYSRSNCIMPFRAMKDYEKLPEDDEFTFCAAGMEIKCLHTPGHSMGSVCYQIGDVLFSGDTIFAYGYGRYDFPGGDLHRLMASLKKVLSLDGSLTVCSGHGQQDTMENIQKRWNR